MARLKHSVNLHDFNRLWWHFCFSVVSMLEVIGPAIVISCTMRITQALTPFWGHVTLCAVHSTLINSTLNWTEEQWKYLKCTFFAQYAAKNFYSPTRLHVNLRYMWLIFFLFSYISTCHQGKTIWCKISTDSGGAACKECFYKSRKAWHPNTLYMAKMRQMSVSLFL